MARAIGDLVAEAGALPPEEELVLPPPSWNVPPTADVTVVLERPVDPDQGPDDDPSPQASGAPQVRREVHVARWGLVPIWAKDLSVGVRAFNARSETVTEKPTFRSAVRARRCAIPVDGYYEWLKPGPGEKGPDGKAARKRPFYVHRADGAMTFFAGLYEWWRDPAVAEGEPGQWVLSCTILTGPSPEAGSGDETLDRLHGLHDRLPLPMDRATMDEWLRPEKLGSAAQAQELVDLVLARAYGTAAEWTLHEVDPAVGTVRNNGPDLIEPLTEEQGTLL
ncbi:Putative SOS response-associated peptidase YedK [Micrococcus terreus]|uniref:Abasic site processing protein n=2 Tax=Micrococcus terreus TaxID=574650 RepID=A0A1I7MFZ0_9MICC|nr:Putative SOS response-associated peptidase YedK [Micrococcus terreus]